jgi:hypothetical protein
MNAARRSRRAALCALAPIGRRSRTRNCGCARSPSGGEVVEAYSDAGVSGAKERKQAPWSRPDAQRCEPRQVRRRDGLAY